VESGVLEVGSEPVSHNPAGLGSVIRYVGGIRSRVRPPSDFLAFYLFIYLFIYLRQRARIGNRYAHKTVINMLQNQTNQH